MTNCPKCIALKAELADWKARNEFTQIGKLEAKLTSANFRAEQNGRNLETMSGYVIKLRKAIEPFANAVTIQKNGTYTYAGSEAIPEFKYFKAAKRAYDETEEKD